MSGKVNLTFTRCLLQKNTARRSLLDIPPGVSLRVSADLDLEIVIPLLPLRDVIRLGLCEKLGLDKELDPELFIVFTIRVYGRFQASLELTETVDEDLRRDIGCRGSGNVMTALVSEMSSAVYRNELSSIGPLEPVDQRYRGAVVRGVVEVSG